MLKLIFLKAEIAKSVRGPKITRAPCRRRSGGAVLLAENFGDLITADLKVLSDNCESRYNHRYAVVVQDLATQWIPAYPCKTKNSQETENSLQKFLEPNRKPKHWQFLGIRQILWRSLLESLHDYTTQIRNKWDCWTSSAQSKGRHLCCNVAIRSEWKLVGRFYGMLYLSAKRHRSVIWWEDAQWKTFWATISGNRSFHLVHWLTTTLFLRRTSQESINLERKSYLDCSSDTLCTREEFRRVTYWLQTLRIWRRWTHRKSTQNNSMRKRWCFLKKKENLYVPDRRWTNHTFWKRSGPENIHLDTAATPIQGDSHVDFLGESEGSLPPPHDSFLDAGEAINDFWSMSGNFIHRHHVEPRVKLYSPREESFPIPLKYSDVSRTTCTNLDVKQERRIDDNWNIDGSRDLSDCWTGFHSGYSSGWETSKRKNVVRGEIDEKTADIQARSLMARNWTKIGKNARSRRDKKWSNEKLHLENARKLRGIYLIDPEDKEFKETIKNAHKKLITPMAPAMPCKASKKEKHGTTRGKSNEIKSKLACILEASEPQDCVWKSLYRIIMRTILQEGDNSLQHKNWYTNLFLNLQPWRFPPQRNVIKTEVPLESDDPTFKIFYCNNMKNELRSFHNKTNWVNFVWVQDFWVLWRMDSISWRRTLEILHNLMQWLVVNTPFERRFNVTTERLDPRKH